MLPRGDGDGWARCALGHRHWGLFGAAGLLLRWGDHVLLQHRATWSHHGGTWGLLGGARHRDESAEQTAVREAAEECGLVPGSYALGAGRYVDDHGGWSYTTVVGRADTALAPTGPGPIGPGPTGPGPIELGPTGLAPETIEVRWVPVDELLALPLHPGFAASWERVRSIA